MWLNQNNVMVNQIKFNNKPQTVTCVPIGHMVTWRGEWAMKYLSIGEKGWFLAHLLSPVITDNEIKDQQLCLWKDYKRV